MKRNLRILSGVAGVVCAMGAIAVPIASALEPSSQLGISGPPTFKAATSSPSPRHDAVTSPAVRGLVVAPAKSLFDIRLEPGQIERRTATLTNHAAVPLDISLSANVMSTDGAGGAAEHLLIGTAPAAECATAHEGSARLLADHVLDQGTLAAGDSRSVCVAVALSPTAAGMPASTTTAHLEFDAIESTAGRPGSLAYTGSDLLAVVLGAASALFLGLAALRRRPRTPTINTDPHTELP
jgi:hypothetical protein